MFTAIKKIIERLNPAKEGIWIAKSPSVIQPLLTREGKSVYIAIPMFMTDSSEMTVDNSRQFVLLFNLDDGGHKEGKWFFPISDKAPVDFNISEKLNELRPALSMEYDRDEYDRLYELFDSVRQSILENVNEKAYMDRYREYSDLVMEHVNPCFREIYRALNTFLPQEAAPAPSNATEKGRNAPAGNTAKEDAARQTPEDKKIYTAAELNWDPQINLSTLPEPLFNIYSRIAEHIDLLDCDTPGTLRFAYPTYCFDKDRHKTGDMWHELLITIGNLKKSHLKVASGKSIYTKCGLAAKGFTCFFKYCPYVTAAYIKYLTLYHPHKLYAERNEYKKNRYKWDEMYLGKPSYSIKAPNGINPEALKIGIDLVDTGNFAAYAVGDQVEIAMLERGENGLTEQKYRVQKEQLEKSPNDKWELIDIYGHTVPNGIAYALLADHSLRTGAVKTEKSKMAKPIDEGIEETVPANVPTKPAPSVKSPFSNITLEIHEPPESAAADTPAPAPEKNKPKEQPLAPAEQKPSAGRLSRDSKVYRCLEDTNMTSFCGMLVSCDLKKDKDIIDEIFDMLKKKGYQQKKEMKIRDFVNMEPEEKTMYAVEVDVLPADTAPLKFYRPGTAVLLCGPAATLKGLYDDPVLKNIYGCCTVKGAQRDVKKICDTLTGMLPESMRPADAAQCQKDLAAWLKAGNTPLNEDGLIEFLYLQCVTAKKWAFEDPNKGGDSKNA